MRAERVLIDCRTCGGSGLANGTCRTCRGRGTTLRAVHYPPHGFTVRGDASGFEADRADCPCFEGICVNHGVAACRHPDNRSLDRVCDREVCPIARRQHQGQEVTNA